MRQTELRDFKQWLAELAPHGFRVLVQPPPTNSTDPTAILKYLARYGMSANRRRGTYLQKCRELLGIDDGQEQHDENN